ncbi:MAG: hypothetical protein MI892_22005, partial [Desulfobacterales bacterium]|nr:hypothetical protein [Desulfobacterales bacterium]
MIWILDPGCSLLDGWNLNFASVLILKPTTCRNPKPETRNPPACSFLNFTHSHTYIKYIPTKKVDSKPPELLIDPIFLIFRQSKNKVPLMMNIKTITSICTLLVLFSYSFCQIPDEIQDPWIIGINKLPPRTSVLPT